MNAIRKSWLFEDENVLLNFRGLDVETPLLTLVPVVPRVCRRCHDAFKGHARCDASPSERQGVLPVLGTSPSPPK